MKMSDLQKKDRDELQEMLAEQRAVLRKRTFQVGEGQLKDVRSIREIKKTIARILTALNNTQPQA